MTSVAKLDMVSERDQIGARGRARGVGTFRGAEIEFLRVEQIHCLSCLYERHTVLGAKCAQAELGA